MTISEVSELYDISKDTLRYYERINLLPPVTRKKSGNRDYLEEDCRWIEFIKCMRSAGLSIEVLIDYISLFQQGDNTIKQRKELLMEQRELLVEKMNTISATVDRLNYKIDRYETIMVAKEKELSKPPGLEEIV